MTRNILEIQKHLNREKAYLLKFPSKQTPAIWRALADNYLAIDSKANYAGCIYNAKKMEQALLPHIEEQSLDWQKRKDLA